MESERENVNPDQMSYEELLALEERVGSVAKGISEIDIGRLNTYSPKKLTDETGKKKECSICFEEFNY